MDQESPNIPPEVKPREIGPEPKPHVDWRFLIAVPVVLVLILVLLILLIPKSFNDPEVQPMRENPNQVDNNSEVNITSQPTEKWSGWTEISPSDNDTVILPTDDSDWSLYRNNKFGFEFKYPNNEGYVLRQSSGSLGSYHVFLRHHTTLENDSPTIFRVEIIPNMTYDQFRNKIDSYPEYKANAEGFIDKGVSVINGERMDRVSYFLALPGAIQQKYLTFKNNTIFIIEILDIHELNIETATRFFDILKSFSLIDPQPLQ